MRQDVYQIMAILFSELSFSFSVSNLIPNFNMFLLDYSITTTLLIPVGPDPYTVTALQMEVLVVQ